MNINKILTEEFKLKQEQVDAVTTMLDNGDTICRLTP